MTVPILVNGVPAQSVDVLDRGLAFGDGIFRTVRVRAGRALNWNWHRRRLEADCAALALELPPAPVLEREIALVAPAEATVKVIVTRGAGGRGYRIGPGLTPTRIVAAFPAPEVIPGPARDGIRVRRCALVLASQPRLAGVKSLNRLESVLARAEWEDPAIREGLLGDEAGHVVEATACNLFLVRGGILETPRLSRCGVLGAQRGRVLELASADGLEIRERDIAWSDFGGAQEVFLTNSLIGLWPVNAFEDLHWIPGPVTRRLQALVEQADAPAP